MEILLYEDTNDKNSHRVNIYFQRHNLKLIGSKAKFSQKECNTKFL